MNRSRWLALFYALNVLAASLNAGVAIGSVTQCAWLQASLAAGVAAFNAAVAFFLCRAMKREDATSEPQSEPEPPRLSMPIAESEEFYRCSNFFVERIGFWWYVFEGEGDQALTSTSRRYATMHAAVEERRRLGKGG